MSGIGKADFLVDGDWNALCFECGRKFKASTMRRHWQGYYVCEQHWEPRQPQDFVRSVPDVQTPPWVQPMADVMARVIVDLPWTPGGSTITSAVLTDYVVTMPTAVGNVIVNIPEGLTLNGGTPLTVGTGWPSGTEFVVNNSGVVQGMPSFTGFNLQWNGNPYG